MTASLQTNALDLTDLYVSDRVIVALTGNLTTVSFTVDIGVDPTFIVTASAHNLVNGSRIRLSFSAGGALPACATPLLTTTDYRAIVINPTTLQIETAIGAGALVFLSNGIGTLTLTEQDLLPSDPVSVLVGKEVSHPNHLRFLYTAGTAAPSIPNNDARFVEQTKNIAVNAANPPYTYKRVLLIRGGELTPGSVVGDRPELFTFPTNITIAPGTSSDLKLNVALANA